MRVEEGQPCLERTQIKALVEAVPQEGQTDPTPWKPVVEHADVLIVAPTRGATAWALPHCYTVPVKPSMRGIQAVVSWHVRRARIAIWHAVRRPALRWQAAVDELQ